MEAAPGWTVLRGLLEWTLSVCTGSAWAVYAPVNQITNLSKNECEVKKAGLGGLTSL